MYVTITSSAETVVLAGRKRKIINQCIHMLKLAAFGCRNYTGSLSFHHRTFAQNLSHPCPTPSSFSVALESAQLETSIRQVIDKQMTSQALTSKRLYLVELAFYLSLWIIKIYLIISLQSEEYSKSNLRKHYSKSLSSLSQASPEMPFNQPKHYCHLPFKVKTLPLLLSVRRKYVSFIIRITISK